MGGILWRNIWAIILKLVDGPDEVAKLRKAESRAIKRRKESKDKRPYDRNNDSGSSAVMRNDIFSVDNKEAVRQFINTGYGYPHPAPENYTRIWTGPQPNPRFNIPKSTVCFYCFGVGHVSTQCPLKLQQGTSRVSMPMKTISDP